MNKNIHLIITFLLFAPVISYAQSNDANLKSVAVAEGYYQTINLNPDTPCGCDKKTDRTYILNKGLVPYDIINYKLHAYKFTFGASVNPASKLFKAFENDLSIYKISMKEWDSFLLLTTDKFDVTSFEKAAKIAFGTFESIPVEEFLLRKNTTSYNEYMKFKQETQNTQK